MDEEAQVLNLSDDEFEKEYQNINNPSSEEQVETGSTEVTTPEVNVDNVPTDNAEDPVQEDTTESTQQELSEDDYRNFYNKVSAPFKANGTDMSVRSADEVIQLMQMGANYTKKMQDLAPYRKTIMMLEKNNLIDEKDLSYIIDLKNKNPEAIRKLVQDSQIDVFDLNTDEPVNYNPNPNNLVSDEEARLKTTVDDLISSGGSEIVQEARSWDDQSKAEIYKDPTILTILNSQKQSGVYNKVINEMKRMEVFGQIPAGTPFLQAYKQAGDSLMNQSQPLTVRTGMANQQSYTNNAQVRAAAMPRQTPARKYRQITPDDVLSADSSTFEKMYNQFIKQV